jgi:replicative DNA helicase
VSSKYYDSKAAETVILTLFKHPFLLEQSDKYYFSPEDFIDKFHRTVFVAIYNLYAQDLKKMSTSDIEHYLSSRPVYHSLYMENSGSEFLNSNIDSVDSSSFDFYFTKVKKLTILRAFDAFGIDVNWLYNSKTQDGFDLLSIEDVLDQVNQKIEDIKTEHLGKAFSESKHAGDGIEDLIEQLKAQPELGIPLYGSLVNTITRGARLKKFYLRSAPTGVGKSRMMVADVCNFACREIYDLEKQEWVPNGAGEPSLFITTELEIDECQTMALAFLSGVPEDHILNGVYFNDEESRVLKAAQILQSSPIWIEHLPDFSLRDIESVIRRNVRENKTLYIAFDYIHSSLRILEEVNQRTNGMKLREDNILFMLAIKIKDLCNELGVFIISGTQLNADWESRGTSNQNVLRGAKAIADKIDLGMITLPVSDQDRTALQEFVQNSCLPMPNIVHHVYKNRRGKFKSIKLWCVADLSICRVNPIFLTDDDYKIINIEDLKIVVDKSAQNVVF